MKKFNSTICKINISQLEIFLNILGSQMIYKKWKIKFENEIIHCNGIFSVTWHEGWGEKNHFETIL